MHTRSHRRTASHRRFWRRVKKIKGDHPKIILELRFLVPALADPTFADHAIQVAAAAYRSVTGTGSACECLGCTTPWTRARPPLGVGRATFVGIADTCVAFALCGDCMDAPDPVAVVTAAFSRDLGMDTQSIEPLTAPGGRA